jgi:hypothetical protein
MSSFSRAEEQYYDYDRYMRNIECDDDCECDECTDPDQRPCRCEKCDD